MNEGSFGSELAMDEASQNKALDAASKSFSPGKVFSLHVRYRMAGSIFSEASSSRKGHS